MTGGVGETCSTQLYTWRMSAEFGETGYDTLVITSYKLGDKSGEIGETGYNRL